jgi:hypothetical protein
VPDQEHRHLSAPEAKSLNPSPLLAADAHCASLGNIDIKVVLPRFLKIV